jgi:uncharacterized glyoxalase superfamily protein PhnB
MSSLFMQNRSMPPGTIIPELVYPDVVAAAEWLCQTFGFSKRLRIGDHRFQLVLGDSAMVATRRADGQTATDGVSAYHSLMVRVSDVDAHYQQVKASGAKILSQPETYPFGERQYTVEDPGGHRWTFSQSVADIDPAEWGGQSFSL